MRSALALAIALGAAAPALAGCAAPRQGGSIVVAPGAAERLAAAWRFGYAGVAPPERPATTRVLTASDRLPPALGERARPGDVLLENGSVSFVVAAADGTPRGGALVDAWSEELAGDRLGALRVEVGGRPVTARSVVGGVDPPTRAAWVDVVGTVETDAGSLEVTTRYDVAPGIDGVLVHTTLVAPAATSDATELLVADVIEPPRGGASRAVALAGPPAALVVTDGAVAHAVLALDGPPASVDVRRRAHGLGAAAPGEIVLHSRMFLVAPGAEPITVGDLQARALGAARRSTGAEVGPAPDLPAP